VIGDWETPVSGRRQTLSLLAAAALSPATVARAAGSSTPITNHPPPGTQFAPVVPGYKLEFPRDHGSHPDFRIEWWYVTGWLTADGDTQLGFQITFFRAKPELKRENPSAFTPRQIVIAHAALSDPARGRLVHAQRAARSGFDLAGADTGRMRVWADDWSLHETGKSYRARIASREFTLDLDLVAKQQPMPQGQDGLSRKGPRPESASYYYSLPHLGVSGTLTGETGKRQVNGLAWLDHEWSSQYLPEDAVGWDWIGINLDDGGALMAFRMRDGKGGQYWAGGSLRRADGSLEAFSPDQVRFTPGRAWQSARTGITYPVSWRVKAGALELAIEPLFDDQEHDARATSGAIYWEGAARAMVGGKPVGRGYLELTGYGKRLNL
jgi:predicted secreted hydrolase